MAQFSECPASFLSLGWMDACTPGPGIHKGGMMIWGMDQNDSLAGRKGKTVHQRRDFCLKCLDSQLYFYDQDQVSPLTSSIIAVPLVCPCILGMNMVSLGALLGR